MLSTFAQVDRSSRQRGLSTLETLMAAAIASTLSAAAAGHLTQWRAQLAVNETAAALETDFHFARSEALARQQTVYWAWEQTEHGTCWVVYTGPRNACRCGASDQAASCSAEADLLRTVTLPPEHAVSISANARSLSFDGTLGTASPGATVRFTAPGAKPLHQIIGIMGRVRTCSPGVSTAAGVRAC